MARHVRRHFDTACHVDNVVAVFRGPHPLEPKAFLLSLVKNSLFIVTNHGRRNAGTCAAVRPQRTLIAVRVCKSRGRDVGKPVILPMVMREISVRGRSRCPACRC